MKPKAASKVKEITLTAVGLRYRMSDMRIAQMEKFLPLAAELRREPENEVDVNAIAVWIVEKPLAEVKIGYLKKVVAHDLAPMMDEGKFVPREVWVTELAPEFSGPSAELLVKL